MKGQLQAPPDLSESDPQLMIVEDACRGNFWIPFAEIFCFEKIWEIPNTFCQCSTWLLRPRPSGASTAPPSQRDSLDTMPSWTTSSTFQAERNEEKDTRHTFLILFLHIILPCCLRFWSSVSRFILQVADVNQIACSSHSKVSSRNFLREKSLFQIWKLPPNRLWTETKAPQRPELLDDMNTMDSMDTFLEDSTWSCQVRKSRVLRPKKWRKVDLRRGLKVGKVPWRPPLRVRNSSKSACTVTLVAPVASESGSPAWTSLEELSGSGNDFAHSAKRAYHMLA